MQYRRSKNFIFVPFYLVAQDLCAVEKHNCEQICVNTPGSYVCQCYEGYELDADGKNCVGEYELSHLCLSLETNQREVECKVMTSLDLIMMGSSPLSRVIKIEECMLACF